MSGGPFQRTLDTTIVVRRATWPPIHDPQRSTTANRIAKRRVMTVIAYLSPKDGSTGPANFVTGVKRQGGGS